MSRETMLHRMLYSNDELFAIYELGRLYFEMGYFAASERIFNGLCAIDAGRTPARVGLGLVKMERGLIEESEAHFRQALQETRYTTEAKLGLCAVFMSLGDLQRANTLLLEMQGEPDLQSHEELKRLFRSFLTRCQ